MARGAAKQRTTQRPRPAQPSRRSSRKPANEYEAQMFFPRLRRQARWVFVFLALVFALGFVFFGVGSGSSLGDLLNPGQIFGTSSNSGTSVSSAKKKADAHPKNAAAQLAYARALDAKGLTDEAIPVLQRYIKLRPKDEQTLQSLATHYDTKANTAAQNAQLAAANASSVTGAGLFPQFSDPKGTAIGTDPIVSAVTTKSQTAEQRAQTTATSAWTNEVATLKKLIALTPDDTNSIYRAAAAAGSAGDYATAITFLQKFLKLAPDSPEAPIAKQQLTQLKAIQGAQGQSPTVVPSSGG
jgi:tetratricopeptide (TPR) repeat protein